MQLEKQLDQIDSRLIPLKTLMESKYDNGDPGHDFAHILRVVHTCLQLSKKENANLSIPLPAAFLHDVINLPKDHPERVHASTMAANESEKILLSLDYDSDEIKKISQVITEHSYSAGHKPSSVESMILQDADRLDAVGAIGLMRMTTCGSKLGSKYYDISEPFAQSRELDDRQFTLDHLYVKLFKLVDKMNTVEGKAEAQKRTQFMKDFVAQIRSEIGHYSED